MMNRVAGLTTCLVERCVEKGFNDHMEGPEHQCGLVLRVDVPHLAPAMKP
jgi:hypothetical protein